ncbi:type I glyceraldehyde-3-phosphate dehydrogenase [Fructilactobacillus lindneri]|uniref:Glyceraldehyde-3-phosphate dehydrogenase n=2 Tax=Fructilactobacillus lindneri TaxID=53444 RepID=A0A0R2JQ74_9LACO|nr:type I glyceraldehyde-3-phosphate dehydrogenase [Fructilactobacillus lindneri]ANZ58449.1 type I glyceraldehyde-3-phosphate dehydrogenase [Fructilactobacillus lindneri]ANZ59759.1 type I glyceraldehyde-3-phosphate dehydrogenase [Fructilactobacillus lindneri]KRN79279.1 glyceraldehyde-3-phosphate dehydrogenase [Fructilactobacillus lindneri DSM 20690 = JCM 11027]POG98447.1 type I glyceraldehyde-3-phosphate dehydrogenase [Fructilactobacillus lindneri]POH03846.1 type I glyceraldehyde-3-phosphate d
MTVKIGINGFGRIGRLAFRRIHELGSKDIEVAAINDLTTPSMLAYLLKYDSVHGRFPGKVESTEDAIVVDGKRIPVYAERNAKDIPWVKNDGVDFVLECTGFYTSKEKAQAHLDAGAKRVLISAPAGDVTTIVPGVNEGTLRKDDHIVSAGSCTTNCLAPMAYWLNKEFGLKVGTMTTVHAYTATQALQDGPRSAKVQNDRAAAINTVPHSSGAAKAIGLVIPELDGVLKGHAQRVAVADGSLTELVSILDKKVTVDDINDAMKKHESEAYGYTDDYIVSSDIIGNSHGSVFDPGQTEITESGDTQLVKTVAWYDNEWGFTCNMVRTLLKFATM